MSAAEMWRNGQSLTEISATLKRPAHTVALDIAMERTGPESWVRRYQAGDSASFIAVADGVSRKTVARVLHQAGLELDRTGRGNFIPPGKKRRPSIRKAAAAGAMTRRAAILDLRCQWAGGGDWPAHDLLAEPVCGAAGYPYCDQHRPLVSRRVPV